MGIIFQIGFAVGRMLRTCSSTVVQVSHCQGHEMFSVAIVYASTCSSTVAIT